MSDLIYGRNTEQVTAFIERCKVLTDDEIEKIAAWSVARDAAWEAAWQTSWCAARDAAWEALHRDTAWDSAWVATSLAARYAACAIVVMDLITAEQFAILTELFAEILVELGIIWKASEVNK